MTKIGGVETNTLYVVLPPDSDLASVRDACEHFGEVACVHHLGGDTSIAEVSFFDVRTAAKACEAFGSESCRPAPQIGNRTVCLPGHIEFHRHDLSGISGIEREGEAASSNYMLEFYDVRDAERCRARTEDVAGCPTQGDTALQATDIVAPPPGLTTWPSLESRNKYYDSETAAELRPPPGLENVVPSSAGRTASSSGPEHLMPRVLCRVAIRGLPNAILSQAMFDAVLEQAGVGSAVLSSSTEVGRRCGKATVTFSNHNEAERCVHHFHGRKWDNRGTIVEAQLLSQKVASPSCARENGVVAPTPGEVDPPSKVLSAEATPFTPCTNESGSGEDYGSGAHQLADPRLSWRQAGDGELQVEESGFWASRWQYIGSTSASSLLCASASQFASLRQQFPSSHINSDMSTEVGGESELEDCAEGVGMRVA